MVELEREGALPPKECSEPEHLNITLSPDAQHGVLLCIERGLRVFTTRELKGEFDKQPRIIGQIDEARSIAVRLRKNLRFRDLSVNEALDLGLTELIPSHALEEKANRPPRTVKYDAPYIDKARYFLEKERKRQ